MRSHADVGILILEDQAHIARSTENMVARLGYQITASTENVAGALLAIAARLPDIALLDLELGEETSLLVASHCRTLGISVVFTIDDPLPDVDENYSDMQVLVKPFGLEGLRLALKAATRQRSLTGADGSLPR